MGQKPEVYLRLLAYISSRPRTDIRVVPQSSGYGRDIQRSDRTVLREARCHSEGPDQFVGVEKAMWLVVEVETLVRQHHGNLQIGRAPQFPKFEIEGIIRG